MRKVIYRLISQKLCKKSPPDTPASSYDGLPSVTGTVGEDSSSINPLKDSTGTLGVSSLEPDFIPLFCGQARQGDSTTNGVTSSGAKCSD